MTPPQNEHNRTPSPRFISTVSEAHAAEAAPYEPSATELAFAATAFESSPSPASTSAAPSLPAPVASAGGLQLEPESLARAYPAPLPAPAPAVRPLPSPGSASGPASPGLSADPAGPSLRPFVPATQSSAGRRLAARPFGGGDVFRAGGGFEGGTGHEELRTYTYPVMSVPELLALDPDTRQVLLSESGGPCWYAGSLGFVVGGGGVGKSRWVRALALSAITGREFCGFRAHFTGKWLFLNAEDNAHRTSADLKRLMTGMALTEAEQALVAQNLFQTASRPGAHMPPTEFSDPAAVASLRLLAAEHAPAVVVVDPWESFIINGDVNDAAATRRSLEWLQDIFPTATLLVVHHSREGVEAIKAAFGFNASSFGKGSKTSLTKARFVINITAKNSNLEDGAEHGLVIACGKSNDSKKFVVRAVDLGADGVYRVDPTFDVKAYLDALEGRRRPRTVTQEQVVAAVRAGRTSADEIHEHLGESGKISQAAVYELLGRTVRAGLLTRTSGPRGKGVYEVGEKAG